MHAIWCVAQKELNDGLRNRWIIAITVMFALLSGGISWFGAAASGAIGFTTIGHTIASLSSLAVFLVPLIALLLAYDAIVGEDEDGTLLLLLTYPLTKTQLLLGKLTGHGLILGISALLGFGSSALTIALFASEVDLAMLTFAFGQFIISATLLGMIFIAIAYLISTLVSEKSKAAGMALIFWFVFVLIFDLVLLAFLVATEGQLNPEGLPYLLLLNPTNIFQLINLTNLGDSGTEILILASDSNFSPVTLFSLLIGWLILPLAITFWLFIRRNI